MSGEVVVALLGADRQGHKGGEMVDGLGGGLGVRRGDFDRGDADGGHDLRGFLGGGNLGGFVLGPEP